MELFRVIIAQMKQYVAKEIRVTSTTLAVSEDGAWMERSTTVGSPSRSLGLSPA